MNNDFEYYLEIFFLFMWNLFPNGTMLLATWFSAHFSDVLQKTETEDDFFLPVH